jgi:LacI family transcriptional regulator
LATIQQVAELAGLSKTTVSHILGQQADRYSPQTRRRVVDAARELGYCPNHFARALATGQTRVIRLELPSLDAPVSAALAETLREIMRAEGYELILSQYSYDRPDDLAPQTRWPIDGQIVVLVGPSETEPVLRRAVDAGAPVVAVGGGYVPEGVDVVGVALEEEIGRGLEHLAAGGRQRIAMLADLGGLRVGMNRCQAYHRFCRQTGRAEIRIISQGCQFRHGREAVLQALSAGGPRPDAIFALCDDTAIGAMSALAELHLRVPEDVAVLGCDGIKVGGYLTPSLTTIAMPVAAMCRQAWDLLRQRMVRPDLPFRQVMLAPTLIIRNSTGPGPGAPGSPQPADQTESQSRVAPTADPSANQGE